MKADSPPRGRRKSTTPRTDPKGIPLDRTSNPRISAAPRDTVEVRPSWIEADPTLGAVGAVAVTDVSPPTLIGAAADRDTLEARNSWLQVEDEEDGEEGSSQGRSAIPPPLPVVPAKADVAPQKKRR